jgi:hypothetical protein
MRVNTGKGLRPGKAHGPKIWISQQGVKNRGLRREDKKQCIDRSVIESIDCGLRCKGEQRRVVIIDAADGEEFFGNGARSAARRSQGEAVCTENPIRIDWGRESPNVSAQ